MTFVNVCGPHDDAARRVMWSDLTVVHANSNGCLCLMGDFNVVRNASERKGCIFSSASRS